MSPWAFIGFIPAVIFVAKLIQRTRKRFPRNTEGHPKFFRK